MKNDYFQSRFRWHPGCNTWVAKIGQFHAYVRKRGRRSVNLIWYVDTIFGSSCLGKPEGHPTADEAILEAEEIIMRELAQLASEAFHPASRVMWAQFHEERRQRRLQERKDKGGA